jgi:cytoskeletal protein RodZ
MAYKYKKQTKKLNRKSILIGTLVVIVLCGAIFILAKQIFNSTTTIPSTTPSQSKQKQTETGTLDKQNNSSSGSSTDKSNDKTGPSTSTAVLLAPSGSFVSNHRPSMSSNGSPSSEQSVCNTTPGASCEIQFTKGTETKKLAAQTVDSNGSTYWNWDINSAGITEGQWQITAYATLNGKTLSATDAMALEVAR